MRPLVYISGLAVVVCACRDAPKPPSDQPRLQLEEEFATAVPDSSPLIGVTAESSGRLVAWSQSGAFLVSSASAPVPLPITLSGVPAGAGFAADSVVEVVDPAGSRVRRSTRGREIPGAMLPAGLRVVDAVRTDAFGWVVGGLDGSGRYTIQSLDGNPWWVIEADTLPGGVLRPYRLAVTTDGVLLTEAEPPFRTWPVGPDGAGHPFAPTRSGYPESNGVQRWVSAPVVDLGDALVQTLSDLGSDRRVLILFDRHGREQRKTVMAVPMALVGSTRDRRYLVAVRDLGSPEVVFYRWRWSTHPNKGAEQ